MGSGGDDQRPDAYLLCPPPCDVGVDHPTCIITIVARTRGPTRGDDVLSQASSMSWSAATSTTLDIPVSVGRSDGTSIGEKVPSTAASPGACRSASVLPQESSGSGPQRTLPRLVHWTRPSG